MKKYITILLFLILSLPQFAASISGIIVDANTLSPIDFVNVALYKQGSQTPTIGVSSDAKGTFKIENIPAGKYTIHFTFVGYNAFKQALSINNKMLNMGTIKLQEDSKNLKELEVVGVGSQMRFDVDKKVFSVDQAIAASGGSATDVLRNIPSVKVDNEGNVSLRKDPNVEVWINGKPSGLTTDNRAQILEQMPAESIESIEVMTNPSAKFNPEGTAGIINLVLKQNRKAGYYGSISAGAMYPEGGEVKPNAGFNINYSSAKFDAYANVGFRSMSFKGGGKIDRYKLSETDTVSVLNQNNVSELSYKGLFMRAGISYNLDKYNTIGISGFGMSGSGVTTNAIDYTLTDKLNNPGNIIREYTRQNVGDGIRPSLNLNLDYKHNFDEKGNQNLMSSLSYSDHKRGNNNRYTQEDLPVPVNDIVQSNIGQSKTTEFKVDYTNKLTETSRLEMGLQSRISNKSSLDSAIYYSDNSRIPGYLNDFDYNEQNHAAYITYGDRFDKLSIHGGLRAEYLIRSSTLTTSTSDPKSYKPKDTFKLFPSVYISYSLPKNNELQLNYTRRVNRPSGRKINPFRNFSDSTQISYGNPGLAPEYSNSLELNYIKTWNNQTFSASVYYHSTDSVIEDVQFYNANVMEKTYMNISKKQNSGLELVSKNQLFKALSVTSTLNLYYAKLFASTYVNPYDPTIKTNIPEQRDFSWSGNILANFMLSKTFSGQITGEYSATTLTAQGTESPEYQIDFGLRKTFFDRSLSVSLMLTDVFNINKERTTTRGEEFYQVSESYFHRRMIGISATYNFGNMKPKKSEMQKDMSSPDLNMDGGLD